LTYPRLAPRPIFAYRADGSRRDLAAPCEEEIDLYEIAAVLSKLPRYNAALAGAGFSIAQHSVMGAQALRRETDEPILAALFLLHDAHEFLIGDQTSPHQQLFEAVNPGFRAARKRIADAWDEAIYAACALPPPAAWRTSWAKAVKDMDMRMLSAEVAELSSEQAARHVDPADPLPRRRPGRPAVIGKIQPWGPVKAELEFVQLAETLIGRDKVAEMAAIHAAHIETTRARAASQKGAA
jgi:hypothetical protein